MSQHFGIHEYVNNLEPRCTRHRALESAASKSPLYHCDVMLLGQPLLQPGHQRVRHLHFLKSCTRHHNFNDEHRVRSAHFSRECLQIVISQVPSQKCSCQCEAVELCKTRSERSGAYQFLDRCCRSRRHRSASDPQIL